jgi:2'-5' RNA ligase
MAPIAWRVGEFVLIHSQLQPGSSRYRTLGAWPLRQES